MSHDSRAREKAASLLSLADVEINGDRPWDLQVHDERLYNRVLAGGSLAAGESYMDEWWDADDLPAFVERVFRAELKKQVQPLSLLWFFLRARLMNMQSKARVFEVGEKHYDVGNDLYRAMLDSRMTYTCGYWSAPDNPAQTLEEAQEAKLDLVCRKIGLKKGDRVLDIGGGWGSFAGYAAEKYGAEVVVITISKEQAALGVERMHGKPVAIRVQDYREVNDGPYDHIISLGMFEHVGYKNYRTYMEKVRELLKPDGLFLLHTIGGNETAYAADPWFDKYIFPNGMLPSIAQIGTATEKLFVMEDWHNFGHDYSHTLEAWFANFNAAWPELKKDHDERFYRMWKYYLLTMAGAFRSRQNNQLWQIVLSPNGVDGGYSAVR